MQHKCSGAVRGLKGVWSHPSLLSYGPTVDSNCNIMQPDNNLFNKKKKKIILSGFGRFVIGLKKFSGLIPFRIYSPIICLRGYIQGPKEPIQGLGGPIPEHERAHFSPVRAHFRPEGALSLAMSPPTPRSLAPPLHNWNQLQCCH